MATNPHNSQLIQSAISDALESERERVATHLRDHLISQTNLIQAQINAYQANPNTQSQTAYSVLSTLVQGLLQQIYALESDLNPASLYAMGLLPALEAYANQQRRMSGAHISLSLASPIARLPLHLELALYRWIQHHIVQAISQRYSSQVLLLCDQTQQQLSIQLSENGEQHPPTASLTDERLQSLGITITYGQSRYGGLETTLQHQIPAPIDLTERESQVIRLLAQGLTNKEIAFQLAIKPRTIKFHLDNIYSKLDVSTRTEAAIYALQNGLTD